MQRHFFHFIVFLKKQQYSQMVETMLMRFPHLRGSANFMDSNFYFFIIFINTLKSVCPCSVDKLTFLLFIYFIIKALKFKYSSNHDSFCLHISQIFRSIN